MTPPVCTRLQVMSCVHLGWDPAWCSGAHPRETLWFRWDCLMSTVLGNSGSSMVMTEKRTWDAESMGVPGHRLAFIVTMLNFTMKRGTDVWCASMCFVHTCMISQYCRFFSEVFPWLFSLSLPKSPVFPFQNLETLVNLSTEHVQTRTNPPPPPPEFIVNSINHITGAVLF